MLCTCSTASEGLPKCEKTRVVCKGSGTALALPSLSMCMHTSYMKVWMYIVWMSMTIWRWESVRLHTSIQVDDEAVLFSQVAKKVRLTILESWTAGLIAVGPLRQFGNDLNLATGSESSKEAGAHPKQLSLLLCRLWKSIWTRFGMVYWQRLELGRWDVTLVNLLLGAHLSLQTIFAYALLTFLVRVAALSPLLGIIGVKWTHS